MWMILRKHLHCQTTKASAERERTKSYNRLTCGVTWNIKAENFKRLLRINRFTLYFSRWECKWSTAGPGGACLWAWCAYQWSQASQGWGLRVCLHSEMLPQRQKWGESKGQSMLPFYWENCQKKTNKNGWVYSSRCGWSQSVQGQPGLHYKLQASQSPISKENFLAVCM